VENILDPDRSQMTIRCMHIACWIPKATGTHSKYVIIRIGLFPSRCVRMTNFIELNLLYTTQLTVVILQLAVE